MSRTALKRICNPLYNRFANRLSGFVRHVRALNKKNGTVAVPFFQTERETSLELATSTARLQALPTELLPNENKL